MRPFARETGTGGETVALLHGFAGSHAVWREVEPILAKSFRVIAYDLPGHGNSHPWADKYSPGATAKVLLADLAERGLDRVHIAGHSMGGAIAMLMALEQPQRFASMTLFAPGGFGPEINARLLRRHAEAKTAAEVRATLEAMTGWQTPVPDEQVEHEVTLRAREGQTDAFAVLAKAIMRDDQQGAIPRERMAELNMPVSVAWGTIDNVLPVAHASDLPNGFSVRVLPNVGHMLPLEVPDFAARLVETTAR
ncbi:MAG: alpha/beta fold hydrolase [Rhizobiaceae bacterium]|nr:alpha/beta fold hydrolase [Rhizobiaceae bacterium]